MQPSGTTDNIAFRYPDELNREQTSGQLICLRSATRVQVLRVHIVGRLMLKFYVRRANILQRVKMTPAK